MTLHNTIGWARELDRTFERALSPSRRRILLNARTAMNYATISPIVDLLRADQRLQLFYTASEAPASARTIYAEAGSSIRLVSPAIAAFHRFDAYVASDFLWINLPRGTRRIQTFHGVAGKYRTIYDSPSKSMSEWDRLFFINKHRLQHFIDAGAIESGSPAACLIGMPKVDCLVDGSLKRDEVLLSLGIDPASRTVLYAPTWSRYSSLELMGEELVKRLSAAGYTVIVKLHDRSRDPRFVDSEGTDWGARLEPLLQSASGLLATGSNSSRYLPAADVLITDHSSVGFEYLLLDRPIIRIHISELIKKTDIEPFYVEMLVRASMSASNIDEVMNAVDRSFVEPRLQSESRKLVASQMFYKPGTATARAVSEVYKVIDLDPLTENQIID